MSRRILFSTLFGALLGVCPVGPSAQAADLLVTQAQWPGWQGNPGYGQEWEGRRDHCWRMRERFREIRYRMDTAPPWERDRLGARLYEIRERLRHECWGHWRGDD